MKELIKHLPSFYDNDGFSKKLQNSYTNELKKLIEQVNTLLDQMFVETSTISLDYWEKMLAVKRRSDEVETRRSDILNKIRSRKTTTIQAIKDIVYTYTLTEPTITVHHSEYYYEIWLDKFIGFPDNLISLVNAIDQVNPAHLGVKWKFTFNRHIDFGIPFNSHESLDSHPHKDLTIFTHLDIQRNILLRDETIEENYPDAMRHTQMRQWSHISLRIEDVFGKNPTFDHDMLVRYINKEIDIKQISLFYK